MISKSYIQQTLNELDKLYAESTSQKKTIYFSKLALIELCGWVEVTIDDMLLRCAKRKLKEKSFVENYEGLIDKNYGFQYLTNVRPLLIELLGLVGVEKIEKKLEKKAHITLLKTSLGNIKTSRNEAAHTYIKGVTRKFNAPSLTIGDFGRISNALEILDSELKNF